METDEITGAIIASAIAVHKELGPGLLESAYEACLEYELRDRNLTVERQKFLPVAYRGLNIDAGYRLDLLVENAVIVEIKSVEDIKTIHEAQVLTYLRLSGIKVGLLINFNVRLLKQGLQRLVY